MKEFLKKIKLIDHFTTEVPLERSQFVSRFEKQVDYGDLDMFSDMFEVFSSSKNEYKGHVNNEGFKIKRRRKLFDMNSAVASGEFRTKRKRSDYFNRGKCFSWNDDPILHIHHNLLLHHHKYIYIF